MKIYTSYFAQLRNLPRDIVPIAICGKVPHWYKGLRYKNLAPKIEDFKNWKRTHDNKIFAIYYYEHVLVKLDRDTVVEELLKLVSDDTKDVVLICYEKPSDFCHRHLVARWLNEAGYHVKEWEKPDEYQLIMKKE